MFGIGMPEMIIILAVALIVIGPKKLPDLARSLGKAMGEFRKATSDFKENLSLDEDPIDVAPFEPEVKTPITANNNKIETEQAGVDVEPNQNELGQAEPDQAERGQTEVAPTESGPTESGPTKSDIAQTDQIGKDAHNQVVHDRHDFDAKQSTSESNSSNDEGVK